MGKFNQAECSGFKPNCKVRAYLCLKSIAFLRSAALLYKKCLRSKSITARFFLKFRIPYSGAVRPLHGDSHVNLCGGPMITEDRNDAFHRDAPMLLHQLNNSNDDLSALTMCFWSWHGVISGPDAGTFHGTARSGPPRANCRRSQSCRYKPLRPGARALCSPALWPSFQRRGFLPDHSFSP